MGREKTLGSTCVVTCLHPLLPLPPLSAVPLALLTLEEWRGFCVKKKCSRNPAPSQPPFPMGALPGGLDLAETKTKADGKKKAHRGSR